jgi:myo-inositol-1(or 4)-monophosphatase
MHSEKIIKGLLNEIEKIGGFIGEELLNFDAAAIEEKSANQLVSYVDIEAEKRLVAACENICGPCNYINEENTQIQTVNSDITFIIDPLDGTTNFMHTLPVFSISVGLMIENKLCGGIVYEINRKEMFYAWEDSLAFLNQKPIQVSSRNTLKDTLLATGFPYYDFDQMEAYLGLLRSLMQNSRGLRRLGSAAVDLAYTACGRFDAFFEYGLKPWDVAAGAFIVQQAGGLVCDFKEQNNYLFGGELVASNALIHAEFMEYVKNAFDN